MQDTTRRGFAGLAGAAALGVALAQDAALKPAVKNGRLKQSVTNGVFGRSLPFEERCRIAAELGIKGYDLIGPDQWPILKKYGLIPTMVPPGKDGATIPVGINRKENHDRLEANMRDLLNQCAQDKLPNLITFSGNRKGMPDAEGMDNAVLFLNKVKAQAEDKGVTICMELLNSKVDHKDYMCDHSAWGIETIKRVDSKNVRLLFDIYHMQIMEGDIVRSIRNNLPYFAHFHTGGNPGRHEIDSTNELNYALVAKTLAEMNYGGYIAHEYSPLRDPIQSLRQAIEIVDA